MQKYMHILSFTPQVLLRRTIFSTLSQQKHQLTEIHVCRVVSSNKVITHSDISVDFGIPNFGQLCHTQINEDCGNKVSQLLLRYNQNVLINIIYIKLQIGRLYCHQPFHCPTLVDHQELNCQVEYSNANEGIMPESHNIWVQYMQSEFGNAFQGQVSSFPVLYISLTTTHQIEDFQKPLTAWKTISTFSKRCKSTQQWLLDPPVQEYI